VVSLDGIVPVEVSAGPPSAVKVSFRSPPVNTILAPGGTTQLCVDVNDAENGVLAQLAVDWALSGPGALASPSTTSNELGIACVDYHHPAGVVTQGKTAKITATATHDGAEGSDSVTLTPRWATIQIEAKPDSQTGFSPATNTSVSVLPNEQVQLRLTLTGPGATPADPPVPLPETSIVGVEIDSGGGGTLILPDGSSNTTQLPLLDANGQTQLTWDPAGSTQETRIVVTYPPTALGQPGVTATVTLTPPTTADITATADRDESGCADFVGCWTHTYHLQITVSLAARAEPDGSLTITSVSGTVRFDEVTDGACDVVGLVDPHTFTGNLDSSTSRFLGAVTPGNPPPYVLLDLVFVGTDTP
jgi:hypothetical protein